MAARFLSLKRALSLYFSSHQHRIPLFQEQLQQSKSLLSRDFDFGRVVKRQLCVSRDANEGSETNGCNSSNPVTELADVPSHVEASQEFLVKYKSKLKINPRHDFIMVFTCKVCETRSVKMASRESYEKGVVVARCGGCNNIHLIADRLGWFGEPGSVEDFLASRGEEFKREPLDSLNLTLEDIAGEKISNE